MSSRHPPALRLVRHGPVPQDAVGAALVALAVAVHFVGLPEGILLDSAALLDDGLGGLVDYADGLPWCAEFGHNTSLSNSPSALRAHGEVCGRLGTRSAKGLDI